MEPKPSSETIQKIIDRLKKTDQQIQSSQDLSDQDKKVGGQVEQAVEKVAKDPDAQQG